jgi:hypothetical protein
MGHKPASASLMHTTIYKEITCSEVQDKDVGRFLKDVMLYSDPNSIK